MKNMVSKIEGWFFEQSTQKRLIYLGFVAVFILIFALNHFFPIYADDMMYSVVKYGETVSLGENLREIGEFMHYYYFNWGGRVVAHVIAHILLLFNKIGQDIINVFVFCILLLFAYKIARGKKEHNFFAFLFIAVSIFYFTPSFLSSAIWKTGSANYLWMIALTLAFIYPYFRFYNSKESKDGIIYIVLFLLFGILAGWTNENLAPVLFIIVSTYVLLFYLETKTVPRWSIAGIIGVVIGCSAMILAPGNAVRAEMEGYSSLFNSFDDILNRFASLRGMYQYFMLRLIVLYILFFVGNFFFAKKNDRKKIVLLQSLLFFVCPNISIWLTLLSPSFPPRAFMSITVLTIVSIAILYANIDFRKMLPKTLNIIFLAWLIYSASIDYITFLKGAYFLDKEMTKREQMIDEAKEKGERNVKFESIHMDYRFEYTDFVNYYKDYYDVDAEFVDKIED